MSKDITRLLKSTVFLVFGRFSGLFARFLGVMIVVRMISPADYGVLSLAFLIVYMGSMLFSFGTNTATPRYMAMHRTGQTCDIELQGTISVSLLFNLVMAAIASFVLYGSSGVLAAIFSMPDLEFSLRVFAYLLFPLSIIFNLTAIFRGLELPRAKVFFEDMGINGMRLVFVIACLMLGLSFHYILYAYVVSVWVVFILFVFYAYPIVQNYLIFSIDFKNAREFLLFAFPLFGVELANRLSAMLGTFVLAYFGTAEQVAFYNAPYRLSQILLVPMTAMGFMYLPIATKMYVAKQRQELKALFSTVTKWSGLLILPICLYLFIDAEQVIVWVFGQEYLPSAGVIQAFAIGYCLHTMAGPNGLMLVISGAGRSLLIAVVFGLSVFFLLSIFVVHDLGALGVAWATVAGLMGTNILTSLAMHRATDVLPVSSDSFSAFLISGLVQVICYVILVKVGVEWQFAKPLLLALMLPLSLSIPFITRTMTDTDIYLLCALEKRIRGKNVWLKRYTSRHG